MVITKIDVMGITLKVFLILKKVLESAVNGKNNKAKMLNNK